jgi:hypothetical protein
MAILNAVQQIAYGLADIIFELLSVEVYEKSSQEGKVGLAEPRACLDREARWKRRSGLLLDSGRLIPPWLAPRELLYVRRASSNLVSSYGSAFLPLSLAIDLVLSLPYLLTYISVT